MVVLYCCPMPAAILNTLNTLAKLYKKLILSTEMTVKLLELKRALQGCFPFFVSTLF